MGSKANGNRKDTMKEFFNNGKASQTGIVVIAVVLLLRTIFDFIGDFNQIHPEDVYAELSSYVQLDEVVMNNVQYSHKQQLQAITSLTLAITELNSKLDIQSECMKRIENKLGN